MTYKTYKPMYYRVLSSLPRDLPNHYEYGYEDKYDFLKALRRLTMRYGGRVGECLATRHTFLLLCFRDHGSILPEKVYIPHFLCNATDPPAEQNGGTSSSSDLFAGIFGEGW